MSGGGRFDFDDGGTYCGGWEDGKAHGHGVCTGPKGQGEYSGAWQFGFEACGVYMWPSGNSFQGQWTQGKRHGVGVETKGRWIYRGEWNTGFKGRYGSRHSTASGAKYEGTWTTGLQDGYGVETYADGDVSTWSAMSNHADTPQPRGLYQGQWLRGMRHGYGVRQSVPYGLASHYRPKALRASLTSLRSEQEDDNIVKDRDRKVDESRGGFVLKARSDESPAQRRRSLFDKHSRSSLRKNLLAGLKIRKQKSTGDIQDSPRRTTGSVRSTISNISHISADSAQSAVTSISMHTDSNLSFVSQDDITDLNVTETYLGEWKNDKRCGFGISERSDSLKYEGEWYNNKKYGYGVTTFKDGTKEEGKYKNNVLISSGKKSKLFLIRSSKLRERVDNAVAAAQRAAQIAHQKADIAISRQANARAKAEQADMAAEQARRDSELARVKAKEFAPEFHQPGPDIMKKFGDSGSRAALSVDMGDVDPSSSPSPHQRQRSITGEPDRIRSITAATAAGAPHHQHNSLPPGSSSLLSSPLDCAVAGSSTHIGNRLHKYGHQENQLYGQQKAASRDNTLERRPVNPSYASVRASSQDSQHNNSRIDPYCNNVSAADYSRRAVPPNPHSSNNSIPRLSRQDRVPESPGSGGSIPYENFNRSRTPLSDGSLDRNTNVTMDYSTLNHQPMHVSTAHSAHTDRSPDSGLSDSDDSRYPNSRPLQRRKTLPSIVKRPPGPGEKGQNAAAKVPSAALQNAPLTNSISKSPSAGENETYIIENGVRKRVKAEGPTYANNTSAIGGEDSPNVRINRYKIEASSKGANRGSLPDVSTCRELEKKLMPREEASRLSHQRRAELSLMQQEAERRRQQEIVLRLADFKDWCKQRQLLVFVIALNVSLATMFFNLLTQ